MKSTLVAVVLVMVSATVFSGCNINPEKPQVLTTKQKAELATIKAKRNEKIAARKKKASAKNDAREIRNFLRDNFKSRLWYPTVDRVLIAENKVVVQTTLPPEPPRESQKADLEQFSSGICSAVSDYVFKAPNKTKGYNTVIVIADNGRILRNRTGVAGRCD